MECFVPWRKNIKYLTQRTWKVQRIGPTCSTLRSPRVCVRLFLPRANASQMLKAVQDDLAAETVPLDVEEPGGIGLVAAGDSKNAGDEESFGVG